MFQEDAYRSFVLVLVVSMAGTAGAQTCGDADGNGVIGVGDGVQALRAVAGLSSSCDATRCDLDGNGSISLTDGVNMLRSAAGLTVSFNCPGSGQSRFIDNGDGTVSDRQTGLQWEKKTGPDTQRVDSRECLSEPCPDPHDVRNNYQWCLGPVNTFCTTEGDPRDGNAFTEFVAALNDDEFAGHDDWRLPRKSELESILMSPCGPSRCLDPIFGPTDTGSFYLTSTGYGGEPDFAWAVNFGDGYATGVYKTDTYFVRAVRGGSQ